ncbi:MAG: LysM peptidoglycan-binding domain-containing protein [Candidatus Riflebacteria bacterium]|nr:LysM peptidoglycan-binding domain-containing protein [Candidatus Riflebacteria bacterium]
MKKILIITLIIFFSGQITFSADDLQGILEKHDPGANPNPSNSSSNGMGTGSDANTTSYTVVQGDNLWNIAAKMLRDPLRYREIVELNKSRYPSLSSNPNLIYPGWELIIPGNVSEVANPSSDNAYPGYSDSSGVSTPPSGAPPSPTSPSAAGSITTRSPNFKTWFSTALQVTQSWSFPQINDKYGKPITREDYMKAIILIETQGVHTKSNGSIITSSAGARGFMQLMPATASGVGVNPDDPQQNLIGGAKVLKECFTAPCTYGTSGAEKLIKAACGYNRGPYASELRTKNWNDYVATSRVTENVGYGIKLKMCLGITLSAGEKSWWSNHGNGSADSSANDYYSRAKGLVS